MPRKKQRSSSRRRLNARYHRSKGDFLVLTRKKSQKALKVRNVWDEEEAEAVRMANLRKNGSATAPSGLTWGQIRRLQQQNDST